jgi:hypothetical protein
MVVLCGSRVKSGVRAGGAALLGALLVGGCGSRTSMLDLEGFDDGFGGSLSSGGNGSKGGGASRGGSGSKGGSIGRGGTGAAGAPSNIGGKASTTPNTPATQPCRQYCAGYSVTCAEELESDNCQGLCEEELNAAPPACEALGIEAVKCLTPFFRAGSGSCEAATSRGLMQCGATLAKFKMCSGATTMPPDPGPGPGPGPGPRPPGPGTNEPASCANMGTVSPTFCQISYACATGLYDISCETNPDGRAAHCSCYRGDGVMVFDLSLLPSSSACYQAFKYCP